MKTLAFLFVATVLEACGDAIVRMALHQHSATTAARIGLFLLGGLMLTLYGTSLNLAPVEFAVVTGVYVAVLFVVFQAVNYLFFHVAPTLPVVIGGALIVVGGLIVSLWHSN